MQPNLYNGKEYEQVHGYNVYDFGARGYYAAVARFTSIDPLAENTPWQSPYSYASNQVSGNLIFISYLINDGFWDPNFIFEYLSDKESDKKGPRYELGGYPYDYVPYVSIYNK